MNPPVPSPAGTAAPLGGHARIVKPVVAARVAPNLADYAATCRAFNWPAARALLDGLLDGLPGGRGLNIAHEAVGRHRRRGGDAETPELNGFWKEEGFRSGEGVHVGWAVALRGGGLVAPAIHHADRQPLDALMAAMRDLVTRARSVGLRGSELTDATITITGLGDRGAESVLPIIHPPQVAIQGFGRVAERPWVVDGAVAPRRIVQITLAGDHRASDGHRGGLLLARIEALLQKPEAL